MISAVKTNKKFKNIESPKMVSKRLYGHYLRSYEQIKNLQPPRKTGQKFLGGEAVSDPQKLGDFFKKMVSKNNGFSFKNTQKVEKYCKSKNGVKTALRLLFKELWAN